MNTHKYLYTLLTLVILLTVPGHHIIAQEEKELSPALTETPDGIIVKWYAGGGLYDALLKLDEVAVVLKEDWSGKERLQAVVEQGELARQYHPQARVSRQLSDTLYLKRPEPVTKEDLTATLEALRERPEVKDARPIIYSNFRFSEDTTQRGRTGPSGEMQYLNTFSVAFLLDYSEEQILALEREYGLTRVKSVGISPNQFMYQESDIFHAFDLLMRLNQAGHVRYAVPDWAVHVEYFSLSDPLLGEQWHLQNTGDNAGTPAGKAGEDLNILPVWESYRASHTGSSPKDNQIVGIVDTGIELRHDDLFPNMSSLQQYHWDYVEQNADPSPTEADDYHGTAVAGLAGARGDNALGISGTAPLAGIDVARLSCFVCGEISTRKESPV